MMEINDSDMRACGCCGQMRPFPTREGLWEYNEDPSFNQDGSLLTEIRLTEIMTVRDGKKLDPPVSKECVYKHEQVWRRVSVVDVSRVEGIEGPLLIVPVGKVHAAWWPSDAMWRKVGDKPEIDWKEVVCDNVRLGDGARVFEKDEDDE